MPLRKWARVLESGAHGLRRGAWYPVVNDASPAIVILDVNKNNVPVDRTSVGLADEKPEKWSVVKWNPAGPIPRRISQQNLPLTYGVCPHCRARAELSDNAFSLECPECKKTSEVDWVNTC
ncbi:MAG: hypothetical protein HY700_15345 [Gemmatimonadetes bacterium]|nr:hypothetical protein [Gemmatimonadota bacterium]